MKRKYYFAYIFLLFAAILGCDKGLEPQPVTTSYVNGMIHYVDNYDNWLAADSIKDLRVVAFKNFPPTSVFEEVLSGRAYFTNQSLPTFVDSSAFSLEIADAPATMNYIAVVQQFGGIMDWRVVGLYSVIKDSAAVLEVRQGKIYNLRIDVDFKNLPKQPF
ncbi:MAG: hypothetical protein A2X64_10720 [Ignavibacteria bacterium GWF2_33_9]|nr:MAG: hypothetical protein A2X64_10720 [Ignavibacteria bacterium GWF2_33_9]